VTFSNNEVRMRNAIVKGCGYYPYSHLTFVVKMADMAVDTLRRLSSDLSFFTDGIDNSEDVLDSFIVSIEFVYRELIVLETTSQLTPVQCQATAIVRSCLSSMRSYELRNMRENNLSFQVTSVLTGMVGRPRLEVSYEQLSFLIENRFSVPQIADMVGVSVRTIRRMSECGLSIHAQYASISDSELDTMVGEVQRQFPMIGKCRVISFTVCNKIVLGSHNEE
jgi:hypothetical protein